MVVPLSDVMDRCGNPALSGHSLGRIAWATVDSVVDATTGTGIPPPPQAHGVLLAWAVATRTQDNPMAKGTYRLTGGQLEPQELNWAGQPIRYGEGYGGKPEHISETCGKKPALAAAKKHQHFAVISEENVGGVFGHGAFKLTRAEAAKHLELLTKQAVIAH